MIFIRRGGSIVCLVDGSHRYSSDLPQVGLKIPKFVASNSNKADKTRQQLESTFIHASNFTNANTATFSNEVVAVMVDRQLQSEAQSSSTPINGDISIDSPCLDITASVDDAEKIIIREEFSDIEINYAQRLLKDKHPNVGSLRTTLYKGIISDSVQIVHCSARHHWITVSTINCKKGEVRVFDSLFADCDKETEAVIHSLYQCHTEKIKIILSRCQKQSSEKDCGLFAIAFAVALILNNQPSKLKFNQQKMRSHLVECFTKQQMTPFPCIHKYIDIGCDFMIFNCNYYNDLTYEFLIVANDFTNKFLLQMLK